MPVPSDSELPKRDPGASPMAAAGAKAGGKGEDTVALPASYTIKRLGPRRARGKRWPAVIGAAVVLVVAGGAALAALGQGGIGGHAGRAAVVPSQSPHRPSAVTPVQAMPTSSAPSAAPPAANPPHPVGKRMKPAPMPPPGAGTVPGPKPKEHHGGGQQALAD